MTEENAGNSAERAVVCIQLQCCQAVAKGEHTVSEVRNAAWDNGIGQTITLQERPIPDTNNVGSNGNTG